MLHARGIGGFGGKEGKGARPRTRARHVRVALRPRATRARECEGGFGGEREPRGKGGRLTSVNVLVLVCGPVLGWVHDHETRDPCNHQRDHEGDRLRACPGRRPPVRHPDRRHRCTRGHPAHPGTCGPDLLDIRGGCPRHLWHDDQAPHRRGQVILVPHPAVGLQPQDAPAGRTSSRVLPDARGQVRP
nr:MAG TPA: hypothetical protein [Caudoviricetes sp.]